MLHQRPNTFAQTCLLALTFSLQSDGGPYIYGHLPLPFCSSHIKWGVVGTILMASYMNIVIFIYAGFIKTIQG